MRNVGFTEQSPFRKLMTLGYTMLRWLLMFVLISLGLQTVYFAMPASPLPWRVISPGSFAITIGLVGGSLGFRYFVNSFSNYKNMYGDLGGLLVLMIWFYYCSLFLLVGGQIDSTVFRISRRRLR